MERVSKEEIKKIYETINYYEIENWKKIPLLTILAEVLVKIIIRLMKLT